MKKLLYKAINNLGYNFYNKKKKEREIRKKLERFEVEIHKNLLLYSYKYIKLLAKKFPDLSITDAEDSLKVCFNNLTFYIESQEEFLILKEIFIDEEYKFVSKEDCVLIDIGANIGIASMYFSQFEYVHKIYAFEPVKDTYELAVKNFKANNINKICEFNNYGIGASDKEVEFLYSKKAKGNSGVRGRYSPAHKEHKISETRKVKILDVKKVLNPIIQENKDLKIVIKMDCEGSEYEIMSSLDDNSLLERIDIFIIEWHDHKPDPIENVLRENNFSVFSRNLNSISGMITAVKN
jgi:FkbM family methyltransferase